LADIAETKKAWVAHTLGVAIAGVGPQGRPEGAAVRVAKGLLLWNQTRSHIAQQVKTLQTAIIKQTQDEADFKEITANIHSLEDVLELLDDRLTEQLNALRMEFDPAEKAAISGRARKLVSEYQASVAANGLINAIDDNGFVPLDILPRVKSTLAAVLTTI
jgi:predicted transcriptional regulator